MLTYWESYIELYGKYIHKSGCMYLVSFAWWLKTLVGSPKCWRVSRQAGSDHNQSWFSLIFIVQVLHCTRTTCILVYTVVSNSTKTFSMHNRRSALRGTLLRYGLARREDTSKLTFIFMIVDCIFRNMVHVRKWSNSSSFHSNDETPFFFLKKKPKKNKKNLSVGFCTKLIFFN